MKQRILMRTAALAAVLCLCLAGCGRQPDQLETEISPYGVTEADIARMPYSLTGQQDGWTVSCLVRAATQEEKDLILQEISGNRQVVEENFIEHRVMDEEQYQSLIDVLDRQAKEVAEQEVYLSSITGEYDGERDIAEEAELLQYQLRSTDGRIAVSGAVDTRSLDTVWYRSQNTAGTYAANFFIPAMENGSCVLTWGEESVTIPLSLQTGGGEEAENQ